MRIGHEFLGIVEDGGPEVTGFRPGVPVVAPFVWADNTCDFCSEGLQTSCRHGALWGRDGIDGGQGEAVRVPQAQGTLVKLRSARTPPCSLHYSPCRTCSPAVTTVR
jgi:threonine dehydrogenase-like Zn-dependent dehydrogenase